MRSARNKANRPITREADEHLMEAMAQRMRQQPAKPDHPGLNLKRVLSLVSFEKLMAAVG